MNILPCVWMYLYKDTEGEINKDATKSQCTYNGGPHFCDRLTLAETYAACIEQPIHYLMLPILAALSLLCKDTMSEMLLQRFLHQTLNSICNLTTNSTNGGQNV